MEDEKNKKIILYNLIKGKRYSNCFIPITTLQSKIDSLEIIAYYNSDIVYLVEKKEKYIQVYFYCKDSNDIYDNVKLLNEIVNKYKDVVISIIASRESKITYVDMFKNIGFILYNTHVRKSVNINEQKNYRELLDTLYATDQDKECIESLLHSSFDYKTSFLPSSEELSTLLNQQSIIKIDINNELAGLLIFEDTKYKSYARILCIKEKYRNNVLGYSLFAKYFNMHVNTTKQFYLWVDEDNKNVVGLHNKFGYKEDGIENYIFVPETIDR